jgi:type IV pilus assembly protein PilY1
MTNRKFVKITSFPDAGSCNSISLANKLCVNLDTSTTPETVTKFSAVGNYLNWMSASKFDVEKKILTGGKWDGANLIGESRGCVGRGFIKQPLSTNNGNYVEGGTNTGYPLAIQIKGPTTSYDTTAPSQGGMTEIFFYKSSKPIDYAKCDEAINLLETTNSISNAVKTAVAECIGATTDTSLAGKTKQIFQQSLQECWQYYKNSPPAIQGNDYLTVKNFCTDVYNLHDPTGLQPSPPAAISVGDADLLCSDNYVGACYNNQKIAALSPSAPSLLALLAPREAAAASATTPGTIQFKSATYSVNENGGTITLLVSRTGGNDGAIDVSFATANGTATAGADYVAKSGTLSWNNNNQDDKSIVITILDDALVEGLETFTVTLSNPRLGNAADATILGSPATSTVTISDNDTAGDPGTIVFESAMPGAVDEKTAGSITLNVLRLGGSNGPATVNFTTANGTALSGSDYTAVSGTLSWASGDSATKTITIPIIKETPNVVEPNETFTVTLSGATGAILGTPATATVMITELGASAGVWANSWTSDACVKAQHEKYCSGLSLPPVTDPTNIVLDQTNNYANLPAVIADVAMTGQMGAPLKLSNGDAYAAVKVSTTEPNGTLTTPAGLLKTFGDKIRVGVMSFNYNGSSSECAANSSVPCPSVCSNDATKTCTTPLDCCPSGDSCSCNPTSANASNADGAKILYPVGLGKCSNDNSVSCTTNEHCVLFATSGSCNTIGAGVHTDSSSLVNAIDNLKAASWTPFSEAFYDAIGYYAYTAPKTSRTALRLNDGSGVGQPIDFPADMNPSQFACQQNYVLLISDGVSTADQRSEVMTLANLYKSGAALTGGACPNYKGSSNLPILSWLAGNKNIGTFSTTDASLSTAPTKARERIGTYVVYNGQEAGSGECNSVTMMRSTAEKSGGKFYQAEDPDQLETGLRSAFEDIAAKAASGTAASILSNSEGSGANILQAVFYPKKIFGKSTEVNWIGEVQNLWYFVDPYIQNSTIREDTDRNLKLELNKDYIVRFTFDNSSDKTMVQRYKDSDGDSVVTDSDKDGGLIDPDYIKSIWRAGLNLWSRTAATRTIYTGYGSTPGTTPNLFTTTDMNPNSSYNTTLWNDMQIPAGDDSHRYDIANTLINYIRGTDPDPGVVESAPCLNNHCIYRNRRVTIGFCTSDTTKRCAKETEVADCGSVNGCSETTHEWKLGDIISSTPRVQSTVRLNTYNLPPSGGYNDQTYLSFINSKDYKDNGMVYVGANDGMLHAFNLGVLDVTAKGFLKATLDPGGVVLGDEKWAFIPKNSIPYLKYFSDEYYDHIYYVDGRTTLLDASIGKTCASDYWECPKPRNGSIPIVDGSNNLTAGNPWRTVVIAGMGLGGASVDPSVTSCTEGKDGDCVKTPVTGLGYSSYFALDVTDPIHPRFLWEFSNDKLGYATTAPAIVRIGDKDKNGRWFAVFGNGPLGPIDIGANQFKGQSVQHLRFFVVDLLSGTLVATLNDTDTLGLTNAFVGTMLGGSIDADRRDITMAGNYQDDAVFAGYVQKTSGTGWTDGGVVRIMTKEDIDPNHWTVSKVISGIGPVTTAIARTQDTKNRNLWLYFGTGRFYYRDTKGLDDYGTRRSLFGIQEPCYNTADRPGNVLDPNCTTTLSDGSLQDQTTTIHTMTAADKGWRIDMDAATTSEGAERVVTDTVALTNGTVFYTSFKPTMDICGYGGNSFLWGVKYDTGGEAAANALVGKALIQLSTGEFKEVDLSAAFTDKLKRRMETPMTGKPPSDAPPIVSSSANRPVKKILHIQEH